MSGAPSTRLRVLLVGDAEHHRVALRSLPASYVLADDPASADVVVVTGDAALGDIGSARLVVVDGVAGDAPSVPGVPVVVPLAPAADPVWEVARRRLAEVAPIAAMVRVTAVPTSTRPADVRRAEDDAGALLLEACGAASPTSAISVVATDAVPAGFVIEAVAAEVTVLVSLPSPTSFGRSGRVERITADGSEVTAEVLESGWRPVWRAIHEHLTTGAAPAGFLRAT